MYVRMWITHAVARRLMILLGRGCEIFLVLTFLAFLTLLVLLFKIYGPGIGINLASSRRRGDEPI